MVHVGCCIDYYSAERVSLAICPTYVQKLVLKSADGDKKIIGSFDTNKVLHLNESLIQWEGMFIMHQF